MHQQLWISEIKLNANWADIFDPWIDFIKTFKIQIYDILNGRVKSYILLNIFKILR